MTKNLILLILLSAAPAAWATDFAGYDLLIPIAARVPGALGSNWRTDLFVTNANRQTADPPERVHIVFVDDRGIEKVAAYNIAPLATVAIKDAVFLQFGIQSGFGIIRVVATTPAAKITARARIYNIGSTKGEFGQTVPAIPATKLSREAYLPGLSNVDGNRTNLGIANPSSAETSAFISLISEAGELLGGFSIVVGPNKVRQLNGILGEFQTGPIDNATIQVTSGSGVYPYASIVRADSGDADFVVGTGVQIDTDNVIVTPACANPAQLKLAPLPVEGWFVIYQEGTNAEVKTAELSARYGFTATRVFQDLNAFSAVLTPAILAALRCEAGVQAVEQNGRLVLNP